MTSKEDWEEVTAQIRADGGPWKSPSTARLFELAERYGAALLATHRDAFGKETVVDVIRDLLVAKIDSIVNARSDPRAYFATAAKRRMLSWRRRGDARVESDDSNAVADEVNAATASVEFVLDARLLLSRLSERDQHVVQTVAAGEDPEDVARSVGTSRANVYKIVSRLRIEWALLQKGDGS